MHESNKTGEVQAIVLGAGPAGYVCAIRLAQLGVKAVCVEEAQVGGVCLNWGCVPSKALIANAHFYEQAQRMPDHGVSVGSLSVDVPRMQSWKSAIVERLTSSIRGLLQSNGVGLVEGRARLVDRRTVEVTSPDGSRAVLRATKAIVLASGSETAALPGFDFDRSRIIGAREAVSLNHVPRRLLVVGGGVIGLELGMAYQAFGSQLTVVELSDRLLPGVDADCVRVVERAVLKGGGTVHVGTRAVAHERNAGAGLTVTLSTASREERVECDVVLVAVGMRARSRGIGLEALGVEIDEAGFVSTDQRCETNVPGVYAIGDVSGAPMLAHKASKEGETCAEVIAGRGVSKARCAIPNVVFTRPEVAWVGVSELQAKERGVAVKVGRFPFSVLGRALSIGEPEGFVKVITEVRSGRILGVQIVGPSASDLISEAALALQTESTAEDMALSIHPHPTLAEALMEASAASIGQAIHVLNRR